jgi:hypothetical protein
MNECGFGSESEVLPKNSLLLPDGVPPTFGSPQQHPAPTSLIPHYSGRLTAQRGNRQKVRACRHAQPQSCAPNRMNTGGLVSALPAT